MDLIGSEPQPEWLGAMVVVSHRLCEFGTIVPLLVGLWGWHRLSASARIIVLYFAFWFAEAFADYYSCHVLNNNRYLFHITVLVETWLLAWAYAQVLSSRRVLRWLWPALWVFSGIAIIDAYIWDGDIFTGHNPVARSAQVMLLLSLMLLYLEQFLIRISRVNPWHEFMFTITAAHLIYYLFSLMVYLLHSNGTNDVVGAISALVVDNSYIITIILSTVALWRDGKVAPEIQFSRPQRA